MDYISQIKAKYRFVTVHSAYELMDHSLPRIIFPGMIDLKTKGYKQEYPQGVLPFDSSDFFAVHLLLCDITGENPRPVLGFKSMTLKACDEHRTAFPMLAMLERHDNSTNDRSVVQKILEQYRTSGREEKIAYNGSFTILPELREDRALMKHLWELSFSFLANYYSEYGIEHVLAVCATKFHVNQRKESVGWKYIKGEQDYLAEYQCRALFGAPLVPMELHTSHPDCQKSRIPFKEMWEQRLVLSKELFGDVKKAA